MPQRRSEAGNVFYIILIGIVLFGALMFTFARGVRQGTGNLDGLQVELAASDILSFTQKTERVVTKIISRPYSEDQINFVGAQGFGGAYANLKCTSDECRVFSTAGGNIAFQNPQPDWFDPALSGLPMYGRYIFTARYCIAGVGNGTCAGATGSDLVMILTTLRQEICEEINNRLGITSMPSPTPSNFAYASTVKFNGTYPSTLGPTSITDPNIDGRRAFCMFDSANNKYDFYQVLIAR